MGNRLTQHIVKKVELITKDNAPEPNTSPISGPATEQEPTPAVISEKQAEPAAYQGNKERPRKIHH